MRIGYLVPEFPGQTHAFFWREIGELNRRGIETDLVSTRRPAPGIVSHSWAAEAMARTLYLADVGPASALAAAAQAVRAGPARWLEGAQSLLSADGLSFAGRLRLSALAALGARLAAVGRARGWRHLHAHSCADSAHLALFSRLLGGPEYSLTLHGPLEQYGSNQRQKWSHAKFAVVITEKLLGEVRAQLAGSLPPRVEVAPMGVDAAAFRRGAAYQAWSGSGEARIFSCGRLNVSKGHLLLAEAVALLRSRGIEARLDIAGEDEQGGTGYHRELAAAIRERGLDGAVALLGAVPEEEVRRRLEAAHVFALASLAEPLGVAIMEGMAMEAPVVATNAGGVPELVADGTDGLLVPPGAAAPLAEAIERLLRDPALATRLARAGRAKVEHRFHSGVSAGVMAAQIGGRDAG